MTAKSAYEQFEKREFEPGYCLPLAIDSILQVSELPDEYYDLCFEGNSAGTDGDLNETVGHIMEGFFKVKPQPDTDLAALAEFNAFGASPQSYMPDAPYEYTGEEYFQQRGVTPKQLRLVKVLEIARENGCNILFTNNGEHEHTSALHMIDEGKNSIVARYAVRNFGEILGKSMYRANDLAGIPQTLGNDDVTDFAPLPTVKRSYFPDGQDSWELIIFPPDPRL